MRKCGERYRNLLSAANVARYDEASVARAPQRLRMINGKRIVIVLPAYNAEKTLEATVGEIPELVDACILVDDHSKDGTVELARKLGLQVFVHDRNYGYGRNQQTCYREAL